MRYETLAEWYIQSGFSRYRRYFLRTQTPKMLGERSMVDWFEFASYFTFYGAPDSMYFLTPYIFESMVEYYDWQYGLFNFQDETL